MSEQLGNQTILSKGFNGLADKHCTLGIDEAGRGPALGPMVYGLGVCLSEYYDEDRFTKSELEKVNDSKVITEENREEIFEEISGPNFVDWLAYAVDVISPHYISTCMLARMKVSLNEISHQSAMALIQTALDAQILIDHVYVDTVGPVETYQAKLQRRFPSVPVTVSKKADSKYQIVGLASICAKVTRDRAVKNFKVFELAQIPEGGLGSGYPGDPCTKAFLSNSCDPVFGPPSVVRYSWQTVQEIMDKRSVGITSEDVDADDENARPKKRSRALTDFFGKSGEAKKFGRHTYFAERNLSSVTDF